MGFWRFCTAAGLAACLWACLGCGGAPHSESSQTDHGAATPAAGHGADAGGDTSHSGASTNPLGIDPDLAVFTAIIFLVLLAVLWKFAWGPISEALDQRERGIAEQIAAAQRTHEQAKDLLAQHKRQLDGAADEVRGLLEQARRDAEAHKQQMVSEARDAARAEKNRALREIDAAKNLALKDLAQTSVDTAVGLAGRIVRRQLKPDDHADLIQEALKEFPTAS
jgi:F-type H+-transporting ATPase subunit b